MREGKLRHQLRVAPEFQAAGHARGTFAGFELRHFPVRRKQQQAVDRLLILIAPQIAQIGVQQVLLAVGIKRILIQAVGPRREKRHAAERRLGFQLGQTFERRPQDVLPVDLHVVSDVADGRHDGNFGRVRAIRQLHDFDAVDGAFLRGVVGGFGHDRENQRPRPGFSFGIGLAQIECGFALAAPAGARLIRADGADRRTSR